MHVLSFKPEVILYIYMASCIAVLIFNVLYIFADKYSGKNWREAACPLSENNGTDRTADGRKRTGRRSF